MVLPVFVVALFYMAQVTPRVRVQAVFSERLKRFTLNLQATFRCLHDAFQALEELVLILGQVADSRHIQGYNTYGAC